MDVSVFKEGGHLVTASMEHGGEFAFYLYRDDLVVQRTGYTTSPAQVFQITEPGEYQVKCFKLEKTGLKLRAWSRKISFDLKDVISNVQARKLERDQSAWPGILDDLAAIELSKGEKWYILEPKPYTAKRIMEIGWQLSNYPALNPVADIDWAAPGIENRSWGFHLHAWEFIDPVLKEFEAGGELELLDWALDAADNWWRFAESNKDDRAMVWYDMSLSLRAPRLMRLLLLAVHNDRRERAQALIEPVIVHFEQLLREEAFNANNNHGFFAAAASIDLAKTLAMFPGADQLLELGNNRMRVMAERQFAADGGHLEHSPDYHRMLLGSFEKGLLAGLINDDEVAERIRKASYVMGWMVQPDGHLVQFGDSPSFDVDAAEMSSVDPYTEFILSNGDRGEPNNEELCVLESSGYAFVRSPQPESAGERSSSSYLAFQAGFHSRAHKHADDLTFTWFDLGREILVDAGRYGYEDLLPADAPERLDGFYYGAPERMYVEGTVAHNTVSVNGENIQRRGRKPYGSALQHCTNDNGVFELRGAVEYENYKHSRSLAFKPCAELIVSDLIEAKGKPLTAVSWFNVDGSFEVSVEGNTVLIHDPDADFLIRVSSEGMLVLPVRGQHAPFRGWRSRVDREMEPVWNFGFQMNVISSTQQDVAFVVEKNGAEQQ